MYNRLFYLIILYNCLTFNRCIAFNKINKFDFTFNKNYIDSICNLMNLNYYVKNNAASITKYNNNAICYNIRNNNVNTTFLLKDKFNYVIKKEVSDKYKFLIYIKSKPILYNETRWDVILKHNYDNVNDSYVIDNVKRIFLYNINKNATELDNKLFKFFYK